MQFSQNDTIMYQSIICAHINVEFILFISLYKHWVWIGVYNDPA